MAESSKTAVSDKLAWFTPYYRDDFRPLTWYVRRLGGGMQSEDIAQEAMKALWEFDGKVQNPAAFTRHAARWALSRAADKATRQQELEIKLRGIAPAESAVEDVFDDDVTRVVDMLSSLPPAQREVFALHMDGWETEEIAKITEQQPATARSNLRHARQKLIRKLEQPQPDSEATRKEASDGP